MGNVQHFIFPMSKTGTLRYNGVEDDMRLFSKKHRGTLKDTKVIQEQTIASYI